MGERGIKEGEGERERTGGGREREEEKEVGKKGGREKGEVGQTERQRKGGHNHPQKGRIAFILSTVHISELELRSSQKCRSWLGSSDFWLNSHTIKKKHTHELGWG